MRTAGRASAPGRARSQREGRAAFSHRPSIHDPSLAASPSSHRPAGPAMPTTQQRKPKPCTTAPVRSHPKSSQSTQS